MSNLIKTPAQIESMRQSAKFLAEILSTLERSVNPGMSTWDLEMISRKKFAELNVKPNFYQLYGFPAYTCIYINEEVVHGIPKKTKIVQDGDLVKFDCGVVYEGMHSDSAITVPVGNASKEALKLKYSTENALMAGIDQARAGNHIGDISHAIQQVLEGDGYGVVRECTGHGIGTQLHEDPNIPNYGNPGEGMLLKPGMTLAIEPISTQGSPRIHELDDGWTIITADRKLSAHVEHTVLITEGDPEILTLRDGK